MKARIDCEDAYEAQKLASLIYGNSKETNIISILNVVGNELVIALRDKSAHSILLRDRLHVEAFADFMQSVIDGEHKIILAVTLDSTVEIQKA